MPTESYLYDSAPKGIPQHVRKTSNGTATYYPNQLYETSSSLTIKYYYFNGQRIAQRNNETLTYLQPTTWGAWPCLPAASMPPWATAPMVRVPTGRASIRVTPTRYQFTARPEPAEGASTSMTLVSTT